MKLFCTVSKIRCVENWHMELPIKAGLSTITTIFPVYFKKIKLLFFNISTNFLNHIHKKVVVI